MNDYIVRAGFAFIIMMLAGLNTAVISPRTNIEIITPDLGQLLPDQFGQWRRVGLSSAVLPNESNLGPGEAVAYRAYADDLGRIVTLVAAYGPPLGDSVRLHRPEACYVAQGFLIDTRSQSEISSRSRKIPIVHLDATSPERREAVTYWLRDGAAFSTAAPEGQFIRGLSAPLDGALIRVSTQSGATSFFDLHKDFLTDFANALDDNGRALFISGEVR